MRASRRCCVAAFRGGGGGGGGGKWCYHSNQGYSSIGAQVPGQGVSKWCWGVFYTLGYHVTIDTKPRDALDLRVLVWVGASSKASWIWNPNYAAVIL